MLMWNHLGSGLCRHKIKRKTEWPSSCEWMHVPSTASSSALASSSYCSSQGRRTLNPSHSWWTAWTWIRSGWQRTSRSIRTSWNGWRWRRTWRKSFFQGSYLHYLNLFLNSFSCHLHNQMGPHPKMGCSNPAFHHLSSKIISQWAVMMMRHCVFLIIFFEGILFLKLVKAYLEALRHLKASNFFRQVQGRFKGNPGIEEAPN